MEINHHASSSIELEIASDGTNIDMGLNLICIDDMGECYYTTYDYNIMIILQY